MEKQSCVDSLLISAVLLLLLATGGVGALPGGWETSTITDPYVQEMAQFAVKEYNKKSNIAELKFVKVLKAKMQVVEGYNYALVLAAKHGSVTSNYEAVVWDKPWEHFKSLNSFQNI